MGHDVTSSGDREPRAPYATIAATAHDLGRINALIGRAVMTWNLPERVKRLAMPSYQYHRHDLDHLTLMLVESPVGDLVGVAAWEPAVDREGPPGHRALLLHGLYVEPEWHGRGIGRYLLDVAADHAAKGGFHGLLVKAQADAAGFFRARGLHPLATQDIARDYAHRYWLTTTS